MSWLRFFRLTSRKVEGTAEEARRRVSTIELATRNLLSPQPGLSFRGKLFPGVSFVPHFTPRYYLAAPAGAKSGTILDSPFYVQNDPTGSVRSTNPIGSDDVHADEWKRLGKTAFAPGQESSLSSGSSSSSPGACSSTVIFVAR